ncbi:hypothetical protein SPAN111604_05100 [Sphingomonas antarctica]|uniref:hypothetical protein n=1 Tax=Sphingomonas antarctica TaxID=2040274 RepID=UPI0039EB62BB
MRSIALLIPFAFSAVAAMAQDVPAPRPMLSDACRAEVQTLCPASTDRDARRQCMMASRDKLSDGCKGEIAKRMEAMRAMRQQAQASNQPAVPPADNATTSPR